MESSPSPSGQKHNQHMPMHKFSSVGTHKDLWYITREGSLPEVDSALAALKKNGGNIDSRNMFGLTPLHIATWRNHIPIVRRLLAAGADPDARDGESGWSSLHRALHFGHLAMASILLQSGASLTLEDSKCRYPVDLLSGPVFQAVENGRDSVVTEVFSWGSGANYQLGTGNAHIQKLPCKVDSLHGTYIKLISAAKFHSVAIGARGEVYTWGFGRGGRLGQPDFDIHSGQAAVITPRKVTCGLGSRRVKAIAAAKHHTVVATEGGEVFTWGSNREGQLGYTSVDSQPTPRRVSSLKTKVIAVAAANKHTAVVSDSGEIFTWGCNKDGQLGYGTSNSASNYTPRVVEYLKGKVFSGVSAAKYHTIVLGSDGEVFTWGHRLVTPRRVVIARNTKKSGSALLKFHRMERLHVIAVAAGMTHSMALTDDGALFYWISSDPDLRCQQLCSMCGRSLVSISAGKYWTAAVTSTGDVYMWDGKKCKENSQKLKLDADYELEEIDEDLNEMQMKAISSAVKHNDVANRHPPSLRSLCEKVVALSLAEPRNALQLLEIADSLGADDLKKHCEDMVIRNLDYIFTVAAQTIASTSLDVLANLEKILDSRSSEPWSHRRLPIATATFPVIVNSEEEDNESECLKIRDNPAKSVLRVNFPQPSDCFLESDNGANQAILKQIRALRKKLQQIEVLEAKRSNGHPLDAQQIAKLEMRPTLESLLSELGVPVKTQEKESSPVVLEGKGSNKVEVSRKQRRKSKKVTQVEAAVGHCEAVLEPDPVKGFVDVEVSQILKQKVEYMEIEGSGSCQIADSPPCILKQEIPESGKNKNSFATLTKKKNRKGGLSMFLSGALDNVPNHVCLSSLTPKSEGPAWGGAKVLKGPALREIQNEQSNTKESQPSRKVMDEFEDPCEGRSGQIRLSSFLPVKTRSIPITVASTHASPVSDGEKSTPPWATSGTSPIFTQTSFRDIQMQQEKHHGLSHSPKKRTAGFSVSSGLGSPSDSANTNRWFKPDIDSPPSIRSIQIEEMAMKDLKRFYSSVKLVKNQG
ncbi:PREDICTED: uncharacterized protein LOC104604114 isoform X2 [Nelumbo nucifera]|uniref:Uncharacterized protein LOC104604114 isoform X2 n=2 Tax=Nelumbo nucifera TaxID=4432 RepID=A0A1U8AG95_NELNU|nr:PREDICTED: uncharacterized protein LOC104604114 isoform X2 [Nelumbo nucifera]DAD29089.1 TPA_asm: hypothetical protein HUJ06_030557 [Nelumbo nucifera]